MGIIKEIKEIAEDVSESLEATNTKGNIYGLLVSTLTLKATMELSKLESIVNVEGAELVLTTALCASALTFGYNFLEANYKLYRHGFNQPNHNNN